jgi:hypothetical protein
LERKAAPSSEKKLIEWIESSGKAEPGPQCAHHILGHGGRDSALRRWGLAKSEGGKKATLRAIVAVARKLSVLLHRLWVSGEFYKPFPQMV